MRQFIRTPDAPSSPLFSQAIKVGSTLYVSGMAGIDPKTNQLAGSTIQEQTRLPTRSVTKLGVELPNILVSIKMTAML
jgi:2-iminobutanoate/2-iminopropanoate deaminase